MRKKCIENWISINRFKMLLYVHDWIVECFKDSIHDKDEFNPLRHRSLSLGISNPPLGKRNDFPQFQLLWISVYSKAWLILMEKRKIDFKTSLRSSMNFYLAPLKIRLVKFQHAPPPPRFAGAKAIFFIVCFVSNCK